MARYLLDAHELWDRDESLPGPVGTPTWSWGKGGGAQFKSSRLRGGVPLPALPLLALGTQASGFDLPFVKRLKCVSELRSVPTTVRAPSLLAVTIPTGTQSQGSSSLIYGSWNSA